MGSWNRCNISDDTRAELPPVNADETECHAATHVQPRCHAQGKIRCGVAGVGSLGQHHARIYSTLPNVEFAGIFETSDARAAEICAKFNCKRFATIAELGEACDAISVVVPTDKHALVALPLLAQGCHLLIEKPLCASLEEAEQVLAAARQHNCVVQVGHIEHFNPVMSYLEKHTGRPQYITTERLAPYTPRGTEVGVVLDLMIHDIGIVLALVKSPIRRSTPSASASCPRPRTSPTRASSSRTVAWPTSRLRA
jgi:predicted dehydrogenase